MSVKLITKGEALHLLDFIDAVCAVDEVMVYEDGITLPNELILFGEECAEILESIIRGADHPIPDKPEAVETLHNLRRTAERGRDASWNLKDSKIVDAFQHIIDLLEQVGITDE
jgi:hypothetical protein